MVYFVFVFLTFSGCKGEELCQQPPICTDLLRLSAMREFAGGVVGGLAMINASECDMQMQAG